MKASTHVEGFMSTTPSTCVLPCLPALPCADLAWIRATPGQVGHPCSPSLWHLSWPFLCLPSASKRLLFNHNLHVEIHAQMLVACYQSLNVCCVGAHVWFRCHWLAGRLSPASVVLEVLLIGAHAPPCINRAVMCTKTLALKGKEEGVCCLFGVVPMCLIVFVFC